MSSQENSEEISGKDNKSLTGPETTKPTKRKLCDEEEAIVDSSEINKRRKSEDSQSTESSDNNTVKIETADAEATDETKPSNNSILVAIKTEPGGEHEDSGVPAASTSSNVPPAISIKTEAANSDAVAVTEAASSSTVVKTEPTSSQSAIVDSSVSSSTLRPSCRFGIRCYRRNPAHRNIEAHPGDSDYRRPSYPTPPLGTPACQFGNSCYRRNPVHFQQFSHPSDFNSAQNIRNRLRQRRAQTQSSNAPADEYSDFGSDEEEDPFYDQGDSDLDYKPGANEDKDDDDEDDELEFNSERQNCDEFD
ncbi:aprataxin and PNK-like factor [Drosophila montana]|uniref:aprataxin and PNK-like factor n=1 Tax=Drosophila montana TaxID=40370 RepID=UPI00313D8E11